MKPLFLILTVVALLIGCATERPEEGTDAAPRIVPRGLNLEPYEGVFSGYRPLEEAIEDLEPSVNEALHRMEVRMGIAPDPERPRLIQIEDEAPSWYAESRIIGGRSVQVIGLPAAALAQGRWALSEILIEALTHAVLDDRRFADLPDWFTLGAPRWISGRMERALVKRILSQDSVPVSGNAVLPGFDPFAGRADPLSASCFLAYLAETFGPDVLPELARTLVSAKTIEEGLRAALPHDPASLEAGFDTYRILRVSQIAEDPYVIEILTVRDLPPRERVVRLSGLSPRAPDPVVGAAAAEELGLAQFECGDFAGAAETLARVERDYLSDALHPDRDRFLFALSFARRDQDSAAAMRFESFLLEFPSSAHAPQALFELAGIMLDSGRSSDAMERFAELHRRFPGTRYAQKGLVVLAAWEIARHRYALARRHLQEALPDPESKSRLAELDKATAAGLPKEALPAVRQALKALASPDEDQGRMGVQALVEIGPLAGPLVAQAAATAPPGDFSSRLIEALLGWDLETAAPTLTVILGSPNRDLVEDAFLALEKLGATPGRIREMLDALPARSRAAEEVWLQRYEGSAGVPEVADLIDDPDFKQRMEAARILGSLDRLEAIRALASLLEDPSPAVRRAAAGGLGSQSGADAERALAHALTDESVLVRVQAVQSLGRLNALDPIRDPGLTDEAGAVRLIAAAQLLDAGQDQDYARVVALLSLDSAPVDGVAAGVENLLRDRKGPAYEGALVDGLLRAESQGTAMRIVRLMCRRVDQDLGYDPGGSNAERERVAARFVSLVEGR